MEHTPTRPSWLRDAASRVGTSVLVWSGFGIVVGLLTAPAPTTIGVTAGVLAGLIVLAPVGVVAGLIGGRWLEMLIGGSLGAIGGVVAALGQGSAWGEPITLGLISGGLIGASFLTTFWRLPRLLKRLARPRPSEHHVEQPVLA